MDPDTVQVIVRVVAVDVVTCKLDNIGNRPTEISLQVFFMKSEFTNLLLSILIESVLVTSPASGIKHV